jgi:hypothetical protein
MQHSIAAAGAVAAATAVGTGPGMEQKSPRSSAAAQVELAPLRRIWPAAQLKRGDVQMGNANGNMQGFKTACRISCAQCPFVLLTSILLKNDASQEPPCKGWSPGIATRMLIRPISKARPTLSLSKLPVLSLHHRRHVLHPSSLESPPRCTSFPSI